MADYKPTEMMTIAAARALKNDDICFVGIGQPSAACNLARLTHAPGITLIYESGTLATKPNVLPPSISTLPALSARWAWMMATSGRCAGIAANSSPVNGQVTRLILAFTFGRSPPI